MDVSSPIEPVRTLGVLVISPHLDDGVFACGRLLASVPGATVATVFAGPPPSDAPLADWDRDGGFRPGDDVMAMRRQEDRQALGLLGARPLWLDFHDSQYGCSPGQGELVQAIGDVVRQCAPGMVFFPLGLFHSDHRATSQAVQVLAAGLPEYRWVAYEDALYRCIPGLRDEAVAGLHRAGLSASPIHFMESVGAGERKRAAVACYRSQLRALTTPGRPGLADLNRREAYWEIKAKEQA